MKRDAGAFRLRRQALENLLSPCRLCPRRCGVDRLAGETGRCGAGLQARVASAGPHLGEEAPLVGEGGSGTVFLSGCSLQCVFCQNWDISQGRRGTEVAEGDLAGLFLRLARLGCHNLNLVTPTHYAVPLLGALAEAARAGFALPVVWNSSGYESLEVLRLLDGAVDIYLPDVKYGAEEPAVRYSDAPGYPGIVEAALAEMHRQVGDLAVRGGTARRGLLVRHLVLPGSLAATEEALALIARAAGSQTYLNLMDQYRPAYRAREFPELDRQVSGAEFVHALACARALGFERGLPEIRRR